MKTGHQPDTRHQPEIRHQPDNEHKTPSGHRTPARSWIMNLCVKQTMPDAGHGAARHQCNGHRTPDSVLYNIETICQTQDSALYMPDTRIHRLVYSVLSMPDTRPFTLHARHKTLYSPCQTHVSVLLMPETRFHNLYARHKTLYSLCQTRDSRLYCSVLYKTRYFVCQTMQSITRLKSWERRKF